MGEVLFWISAAALLYVFVGYPLLLLLLSRFRQRLPVLKGSIHPLVALIISAYNEEEVIEEKIRNSFGLDYPREKLEVIVVSDASTDRTDDIVRRYKAEGIVLHRMPVRKGKTAGLNEAVSVAKADVIVFSDANTFYAPDVIQMLVRNFVDPTVGCVTGNSCYVDSEVSNAGKNENTYWGYERFLKIKESEIGSMVGSDGALFAVRKALAGPLKTDDINDFVMPLQVVSQGYRNVFEPEAICYEKAVLKLAQEFRRKVRIVNRSWHGLFRVKVLLNPWRYGLFSLQLVSHKMLRWLTPAFLSGLFLFSSTVAWAGRTGEIVLSGQILFYSLGVVGLVLDRAGIGTRWLSFPAYFITINAASAMGTLQYILGKRMNTWEPERSIRANAESQIED